MLREIRNTNIANRLQGSDLISYEDYEAIAVISAKYVSKHLELSKSKHAAERRAVLNDLNTYADTWLS